MNLLLHTLAWELRLQLRHQILTIALVVSALYCLVFVYLPASVPYREEILTLLLMTDPSMLGFLFVGVLVLFEKDAMTLQALAVSPLRPWQYLWSKGISLTGIALFCSLLIGYIGKPQGLHPLYLLMAVGYSSLIFVFIGLIGVVRVRSLNQYLILIPFFLVPLLPPIVSLFGVPEYEIWYLFPTQAILLLYKAAWNSVQTGDLIYAILYPPIWIIGLYFWARRSFLSYLSLH